jgi:hypothetical protein
MTVSRRGRTCLREPGHKGRCEYSPAETLPRCVYRTASGRCRHDADRELHAVVGVPLVSGPLCEGHSARELNAAIARGQTVTVKANVCRADLNSDEAPAEIDVARATKNVVPECGACGAEVNEQVERTTRRLLASLDDTRRAILAAHYQGAPPDVLCAGCFNATAGVLSGVSG